MNMRQRKLALLLFILSLLGTAIGLVMFALRQNISLFYNPTQVAQHEAPINERIRVGGMVVKGSVKRSARDLTVSFELTDFTNTITVHYNGILPDLFREGQGIVTKGSLNSAGEFVAVEVLAKHDANYMPAEVKAALAEARKQKGTYS